MDLKKFLPGLDDKKEEEHFWALAIEPGWVQAGIWKIEDSKAKVIFTSKAFDWRDDDNLLEACDAALSAAIQEFPPHFKEPSKTVFGVTYGWVKDGEISSEYLSKIKKICKDLSLTPVGFVVMPEAISHFVKSEEGAPLNGIVIGAYKENLEISLFNLGKLVGTTEVARSASIAEDVVEGLSRLVTSDPLPSRILLYDGREGDLDEAKQALLDANWDEYEKIKFLHTPKIELIDTKRKVFAVSLAGASEIGQVTELEENSEKPEKTETELAEEKEFSEDEVSPEELGFALEKDVREEEFAAQQEPEEIIKDEEPEESALEEESNVVPVSDEELYPIQSKKPSVKMPIDFKKSLAGISALTGKFKFKLPKVSISGQKPILWGLIFFLLLIIAGGVWWWFYPTAVVTIYVSPQKLEESALLSVDTKRDGSSVSEKILAGETESVILSGEKTKETTGTKTVGEKAKGEITIYRVGTSLSVSQGTVVYGPQSLKYVMDSSISVASGSASTPSVTKAAVTAETIGSQYNLAAGSTFTVGNYSASDMEGKNESAFSGGSSREINAVAKEDQESLREELENELRENIEGDLAEKVDSGRLFIKESVETKIAKENFSHKVGDEAKTLKLSMTVDSTGAVVNESDLLDISREILKNKMPPGFTLRGEQINYAFKRQSSKDGVYQFDTRISANLLPEVKTDELKEKIAGKYPNIAQEYLSNEAPGFVRAEIKMKFALPGRLKTLPHVAKNIEVEVAAER